MSNRRSRSRSPRRRRRSTPNGSRRRSEGDFGRDRRGRESERGGRDRLHSSSDLRNRDRDKREKSRSPRRTKDNERTAPHKSDSTQKSRGEERSSDKGKGDTHHPDQKSGVDSKDQENHRIKIGNERGHLSRTEEGGFMRSSVSDVPREKNVLFPSGSNSVNRGRDRLRDKAWREDRGKLEGRGRIVRRRSEGIFDRDDDEEQRGDEPEKRLFDALVDPQEVPRSGNYFEHDDRDAPQAAPGGRNFSDNRKPDRRFQNSSDGRWGRGRDARDRLSDRGRLNRGRDRERDQQRDRERDHQRDRERDHQRDRERDHQRDRERSRDMRSDRGERRRGRGVVRERGGGHRDRSPLTWKHDLFETLDRSPEPEEQAKVEEAPAKFKSSMEDGIQDFNIDDLLLLDNPIEKMELEV